MWFHVRLLEKCNLKCVSCYAQNRDRSEMMDFPLFKDILITIKQVKQNEQKMSVIYLSGGEPLLHPSFFQFLEYCFSQFDRVSILTNGLLVKKFIHELLPYREKLCVQVSLDGDEKINNSIRGSRVYAKVVEALTILDEYQIRHWISYTVSQLNKHCYRDILRVAQGTHSYFNNVTPYVGNPEQMLDYFEWKEFKYHYEKYTRDLGLEMSHGPNCCGFNYHCGAFFGGVTINPDGTLAGCARINNTRGHYQEMNQFFLTSPLSITETCMKAKWGTINHFDLITRLE
jgi:MoaA/NifB/PqqE/SkfB family radical SAM enzyme